VRALAVLSLHTSPLAQPGTGDGGGMNVYVRELSAHLARSGVCIEVFTRAEDPSAPPVVQVEPGFRVHHVPAGPFDRVAKEALPDLVDEWTDRVAELLTGPGVAGPIDAIHANYWLSGVAGHTLKHRLDLPLISTFHTLDRVKAEASPEETAASEPARRALAEAETIGCSDAVLASCSVEASQLSDLYGAPPERVEIVAPGVDLAFFGPGDQRQARRAIGFHSDDPVMLFVGRIQPLKGLTVAVEALARLRQASGGAGRVSGGAGQDSRSRGRLARTTLIVVGGPSGPHGADELAAVRAMVARHHLEAAVRWVPPQPHEMLSTFFRAADVCVVPSHSESFGLVALEAAACGVPVVAAAVGGLTTLIDDGESGYLIESRDPQAYADCLAALLSDGEMAARFGWAGRERAQRYTWASAAAAMRELGQRLTRRDLVACR
jgi:D-inositol-3-phosphate glycosyltransferase